MILLAVNWSQVDRCFVLIVGDNGERLDLIANTPEEKNMWITGLMYIQQSMENSFKEDRVAAINAYPYSASLLVTILVLIYGIDYFRQNN